MSWFTAPTGGGGDSILAVVSQQHALIATAEFHLAARLAPHRVTQLTAVVAARRAPGHRTTRTCHRLVRRHHRRHLTNATE